MKILRQSQKGITPQPITMPSTVVTTPTVSERDPLDIDRHNLHIREVFDGAAMMGIEPNLFISYIIWLKTHLDNGTKPSAYRPITEGFSGIASWRDDTRDKLKMLEELGYIQVIPSKRKYPEYDVLEGVAILCKHLEAIAEFSYMGSRLDLGFIPFSKEILDLEGHDELGRRPGNNSYNQYYPYSGNLFTNLVSLLDRCNGTVLYYHKGGYQPNSDNHLSSSLLDNRLYHIL